MFFGVSGKLAGRGLNGRRMLLWLSKCTCLFCYTSQRAVLGTRPCSTLDTQRDSLRVAVATTLEACGSELQVTRKLSAPCWRPTCLRTLVQMLWVAESQFYALSHTSKKTHTQKKSNHFNASHAKTMKTYSLITMTRSSRLLQLWSLKIVGHEHRIYQTCRNV